MSVYITGDCHGDWVWRLRTKSFPEQKSMCSTDENYVIVAGDFGIWDGSKEENANLNWISEKPFTTLFVDGNHENMDMLDQMEISQWHGGKVHFIRSNVIHLMRGQIYELEGRSFFSFGGAASHDIQDGILDPGDPRIRIWRRQSWRRFRVRGISWWDREMPSSQERAEGRRNLQNAGGKVDYIITHCPYTSLLTQMDEGRGFYTPDILTDYFEELKEETEYRQWIFGHMHVDQAFPEEKSACLYEQIVKII